MEALFHLLFQVVKIAILASLYALILLLIVKQIKKSDPESWFQEVASNEYKFWKRSFKIISLLLFIGMYTYWGNHGLGDSARIPIGNWYTVKNINWSEYGFLEGVRTSDGKGIGMTKFAIEKNKLIGNLKDGFNNFENSFFVLDLKTKNLLEFQTETEFDEYAAKNGLPKSGELKSFEKNYRAYWSGWRFWTLP